jgi:PKD repeat protein
MADTHGFEVVLESGETVLQKVLRGAWKSAECPVDGIGDEGRIPEFLDIPEDTGLVNFGAYEVEDGQIQIPQDELDARMAPDVNGAQLTFGLHIQVDIKDPPIPSAGFFDMTADVRAKVPIGTIPDSMNVGMLLDGLPRANVNADLTSGDPLALKLDTLLTEFVHKAYENGSPGTVPDPGFPTIPHTLSEEDVEWPVPIGSVTVDAYAEIYDDQSDPAHRIEVSRPSASEIEISIPIYLRIFNIREDIPLVTLLDPMGVETRMILSAPFESPAGSYTARLSAATVTVQEPLMPAAGIEGENYETNIDLAIIGPIIKSQFVSALDQRGTQLAQDIGDFTIEVPTVAEIEEAISDLFHQDLESREFVAIWTPDTADSVFEVDNVAVKVLSDALVIALNAGAGANIDLITNFIPADRELAIALNGTRVQSIIDETRADNRFAPSDLPKRIDAEGEEVDLNSLGVFLFNGGIRMTGEVTVIDAILGSIDVDADFRVDIGLHWVPNGELNADGGQMMDYDILDEDVDPEESVLLWVITAILAVLTFGAGSILLTVIVIVIALIVRAIAENIGSALLVDEVSGALKGITAWPPELSQIGRVRAVFHDPIAIDTSGLVMAGTMEVISSCEATAVVAAYSGDPYIVDAASPLTLIARNTHGDAIYRWLAGDGSAEVAIQNKLHTYAASGLYIAKHTLTIDQTGGATSRHFALVQVKNIPPTVDAGPDRTVNEGEVVTLVGRFWDVEYPDTHESSWNFGDAQIPQPGIIQETNSPPRASGTSTVQHAWCDNGEYIVTLRVRDQNGGMATDTLKVTVLNVPPEVDAGSSMCAYPCTVLTLMGKFCDPGWCDTHTGYWDFGDCSPPQTAIIREKNDPPAAKGVAISSHVYERCGVYHVRCTVIDDDGGVGEDSTVVRVVELQNADFEKGFRKQQLGTVANHWEPYIAPLDTFPPSTVPAETQRLALAGLFSCEECLVHSGQRSQRIRLEQPFRAGIYQQIGANPGWDYQVTAWYTLYEQSEGTAWLGIDPEGGTDPTASQIVWISGQNYFDWAQMAERVTAKDGGAITVFLEARGQAPAKAERAVDICFDDVTLVPIQPFCPAEEPQPEAPKPEQVCVDFTDLRPEMEVPSVYDKDKFTFSTLDKQYQRIIIWGVPTGQSKLLLGPVGLAITLPCVANEVTLQVAQYTSHAIAVTALNSAGNVVGKATAPPIQDTLHRLKISAAGIVQLRVTGGGGEGLLFQVCASRDRKTEQNLQMKRILRRQKPTLVFSDSDINVLD